LQEIHRHIQHKSDRAAQQERENDPERKPDPAENDRIIPERDQDHDRKKDQPPQLLHTLIVKIHNSSDPLCSYDKSSSLSYHILQMYQGEIMNLPISRMSLLPQFVCRGFPVLRIWLTPVAEFIDILWILVIRVHRSGLFDQFPQPLRILQHRAGPQM